MEMDHEVDNDPPDELMVIDHEVEEMYHEVGDESPDEPMEMDHEVEEMDHEVDNEPPDGADGGKNTNFGTTWIDGRRCSMRLVRVVDPSLCCGRLLGSIFNTNGLRRSSRRLLL